MSLERTALRLATVMALTNGMVEPYPTIARDRVFDSRLDPIEGFAEHDLVPLVLVYTDDTDNEALSQNNGGPPWRTTVNLVIEISVGMGAESESGLSLDVRPRTEPEMEAMLDLLEEQIARTFRQPATAWASRIYTDHIVRIESWSSSRYVERDTNARLAVRQIIAKVMLVQPEEPTDVGVVPPPLGPLLAAIVEAEGPYAGSAAALLEMLETAGGFAPLDLPALERIRLIEADAGGGNLTGTGPARPDGVAETYLT
jgi:hypothetical protein